MSKQHGELQFYSLRFHMMTKANHKSNPLFLAGCNIAFAAYPDLWPAFRAEQERFFCILPQGHIKYIKFVGFHLVLHTQSLSSSIQFFHEWHSSCIKAKDTIKAHVIDPLSTEAASLLSHHAVSGRMLHFGCKCKVDDDKEWESSRLKKD